MANCPVLCDAGFEPVLDALDLICRISYNYCCSYLLSKLMYAEQKNLGIGCQAVCSSCCDWKLDDVVMFLSETSEYLLKIILVYMVTS